MIYKCIKEFELPFTDEDGCPIEKYDYVTVDTLWSKPEHSYSMTGAEIRLELVQEKCECAFTWIEIPKETLAECFEIDE